MKQTVFSDIKHQFRNSVLHHYCVPDYAQVDLNLVNMANYFPVLKDLIDSIEPRIICEIGCDQGTTTNLLYQYCKDNNAKLHVVDPILDDSLNNNQIVTFYRTTSLQYLEKEALSDVYFIDGDHNYYTVSNELNVIQNKNVAKESLILFLHDVGWPWGNIDMYYDEKRIDEAFRHKTMKDSKISLLLPGYRGENQGLPMDNLKIAESEGGEFNGVLSAVENFISNFPEWKFFSIPSLFGLGVLCYINEADEALYRKVEHLSGIFGKFNSFLSILELNRVMLLEKIEQFGKNWEKQHNYIKQQDKYIKEQDKRIENLLIKCEMMQKEIEQQKEERDKQNESLLNHKHKIEDLLVIHETMKNKIKTQGEEWVKCQKYIGELVHRNIDLDLKLMERQSILGFLKQRFLKTRAKR